MESPVLSLFCLIKEPDLCGLQSNRREGAGWVVRSLVYFQTSDPYKMENSYADTGTAIVYQLSAAFCVHLFSGTLWIF